MRTPEAGGAAALQPVVGVVGLGIMGGAIAGHLVRGSFEVLGLDPDAGCRQRFEALGGEPALDAATLARRCDVLITSLPHAAALFSVVEGVAQSGLPRRTRCIIEASTLSLADKHQAAQILADGQIDLLDAPLSGTGAQAVSRDLSVYVSGSAARYDEFIDVFRCFASRPLFVGAFGNGMKLKLAANLLVAIHNVAAAEAINFVQRCGIDGHLAVDVLMQGAGASRMLALRGPLMVEGAYLPATMKLDVWQKDLDLISAEASNTASPTPLLNATLALYKAAMDRMPKADTAAVFEMFARPDSLRAAVGDVDGRDGVGRAADPRLIPTSSATPPVPPHRSSAAAPASSPPPAPRADPSRTAR